MSKKKSYKSVNFEQVFKIFKYDCSLAAYEIENNKGWTFSVQLLSRTDKSKTNKPNAQIDISTDNVYKLPQSLFEVFGQKIYQTYQDALQDGYGILEYLGYVSADTKTRSMFCINSWDTLSKSFKESIVYFDGYDFFTEDHSYK